MASLVAYDDSDSEEDGSFSGKPVQSDRGTENSVTATYQKPDQCLEGHEGLQCINSETAMHPPWKGHSPVWSQPEVLGRKPAPKFRPRSSSERNEGPTAAKRPQLLPPGVRPYIPKRHRLATPDKGPPPVQSLEQDSSDHQALRSQMLSEVSEKVRPFLGRKCTRAELPRHVRLQLSAHNGPVNTIQWCPVPQLSHLLLSASMDRTVKIWDAVETGRCLQTFSTHCGAVRDVCWTPCGKRVLSGSFDNTSILTDVETGQEVLKVDNHVKITCLALQPKQPEVFLCGGFSPEVKAWDSRSGKLVRAYKADIQQTLDILFLSGGKEFITSSDMVSRDSADLTLIAWDFETTAKVSNQIFHERYTCPSLALHPQEETFVAQTNGNYVALFSAQRPYRMNKRRRFEGHKVEGYAIQCEFSGCGTILASGSSTGSVHIYDHQSGRSLCTLSAHQHACLSVSLHPILPAVAASCDWGGEIIIWR
ncbi:WD repeat-containing protein 25 [Denticeps clupeoides]|uniref:WD repeat-containing protein 25 n=1 Tax=Denticeps clupeoides TaxID=299321 RepID=A0AAY4DQ95_9TELE|nr:WD repeat-containing protein 25 [Denticeps clupeoides]